MPQVRNRAGDGDDEDTVGGGGRQIDFIEALRESEDSQEADVRIYHGDSLALARTGKKQVLERRFGWFSMVGFSSSLMVTWETVLTDISIGLNDGGPAGLIYGFIVAWIGTLSVFLALGELASMLPTAGGHYHWAIVLAPKKCRIFVSYVTGWITIAAWAGGPTAVSFWGATVIQQIISKNIASYDAPGWQGTLIMWGILFLCVLFNTFLGASLPVIEAFVLIVHILGFFAFLIPLVHLAPSKSASEVFLNFNNGGGWPSVGLAIMAGLSGNAFTLLGSDGAVHMSEEVENPTRTVPHSMIISIFVNGMAGLGILIAALFSAQNIPHLEKVAHYGGEYTFISILVKGVGSKSGATVLVGVIILITVCTVIAGLASASRILWAFARDQGVPGWQILRRINSRTSIPISAVVAVVSFCAILGLINVGSPLALNIIISIVMEGFATSHFIVLSLLLYRRIRGEIAGESCSDYEEEEEETSNRNRTEASSPDNSKTRTWKTLTKPFRPKERKITTTIEPVQLEDRNPPKNTETTSTKPPKKQTPDKYERMLVWGPWHIKGLPGILNNIFALCYLLLICFFGYWPSNVHPTASTMNYASLVLGFVVIFSIAYYYLWARKIYCGPIVEVPLPPGGAAGAMARRSIARNRRVDLNVLRAEREREAETVRESENRRLGVLQDRIERIPR